VHLDYIIGVALFILIVALVAISTFQSLSPFYLAAKADQLSMVSDNVAQSLLSSLGNPPDWGSQSSLPEDFQLGLVEYDTKEYRNMGGLGFYSLDPNKLSSLSSSNPHLIPYSSWDSGFSDDILGLDPNFYALSPNEQNSLSSLGLSKHRFKLLVKPPYQLVVTAEPYQLALYPLESSFLLRIKSLTWDNISIPNVQFSFVIMNPKGFAAKFISGVRIYQVFSGTTGATGETTVPVKMKFSPNQPQGVYVITALSKTSTGLMSFCFTPFNVFVIDPTFKVVTYTRRLSSYSSQVVAYIWNISRTPAVRVDSTWQSKCRMSIKAIVFQPNGSVIGPSNMKYEAGGFWTYDYQSPLSGPYLSFVSVYAVNMTIFNSLVDFVKRIESGESASPSSVSWTAASMWIAYYYTGELLGNATRQISKGDNKQLNPEQQWWKWSYDYVSVSTYAYALAYWATDCVHDDYLWNATNYGGNTLVKDYSKWANRTVALNSYAVVALSMLYIVTGNSTYLNTAVRAAGWLKDKWQTGPYAESEPTYDVGVATWAFMTIYQATQDKSYYNLAQTMAYWLAVRQLSDGSWPGSSVGGGQAQFTSMPLIGLCSTWNYTFYRNVTRGLDWLITTRCKGTNDVTKLAAAVIASGFGNSYIVPPFGHGYVSYPMMVDYGPEDIPYEDTVAATRYVTIRGTVYQALLYCWDPEIRTSETALSLSCIGLGVFVACPIIFLSVKRRIKWRPHEK